MNLISAKNPKWVNRSKTMIDLIVRFEETGKDLPFTTSLDDPEQYGREIFNRAATKEFGEIAEFSPPKPPQEYVISAIKEERNLLLDETDWTLANDIPQATKDKWAMYRQALRDIPQQPGFPWYEQIVIEIDRGYAIDLTNLPWPQKP